MFAHLHCNHENPRQLSGDLHLQILMFPTTLKIKSRPFLNHAELTFSTLSLANKKELHILHEVPIDVISNVG